MKRALAVLWCTCFALLCLTPGLAGPGDLVYEFSLDSDPGWTATGSYRYGAACTGPGDCPAGAHTGTNIYGNALAGGSRYSSVGTLTTTPLNCSGLAEVKLHFWRHLGLAMQNASYREDYASVAVSSDGATWYTIWQTKSNEAGSFDSGWTYQEFDISQYADGQPTVYIRWTLGPIDAACGCLGFNIDDVYLTADRPDLVFWLAYAPCPSTESGLEICNTVLAIDAAYPGLAASYNGSKATDAATLESDLQHAEVLIIPEQDATDGATLEAKGAEFAEVLQRFVRGGGTVIVCSDFSSNGFLSAAGLLQAKLAGWYSDGESLAVTDPDHPLADGVSTPTAVNSTVTYEVLPDTFVVIAGPDGNAVVAERQHGSGAVVLLGYDYFESDAAAAQAMANAIFYPGTERVPALVYDSLGHEFVPSFHMARNALSKLRTPYVTADGTAFNAALGTTDEPIWRSLIAVDEPAYYPDGGWGPFTSYVTTWPVPALLSTWGLNGEGTEGDALARAFGAASTAELTTVPPVYDVAASQLFSWCESVPSPLSSWKDNYSSDADRLAATGTETFTLAGFDSPAPAAGNAAIVANRCCTTMIDGFLWDDANQDADADGTSDVQELVTNQVALLLRAPNPVFEVDTAELVAGGTVNFTNCCPGRNRAWCFYWWPEGLGAYAHADRCPATGDSVSYTYDQVGFFFPVLDVRNAGGAARAAFYAPVAVGFPDAGPSLNSFRPIIACVEAGVVKGFGDGTYKPTQDVKRDAMAVYIARAMCGGEENVPLFIGAPSFSDVDPSSWALNHIEYCYANNVVTGFAGGTYAPDWLVNRGQMAAYIARAISDPAERPNLPSYTPPLTSDFPDVATDYSYYKYIEYLYQEGLVTGFGDGSYGPTRTVTRGQMAIYVQRAFGYETYD